MRTTWPREAALLLEALYIAAEDFVTPHRVDLHLLSHQPPLHPCARAFQADSWAALQLPVDAGGLLEPLHGSPVPGARDSRLPAPCASTD